MKFFGIEFHVSDHCNMNCKNCNHYSILAPPVFPNFDDFKNDLILSSKWKQYIPRIYLIGGEPLLNPALPDFIETTRYYFPTQTIDVYTNGLLLKSMDDKFWKTLKKNNAGIIHSIHPYWFAGTDYLDIEDLAEQWGITLDTIIYSKFRRFRYDLTKDNGNKSFHECYQKNCTIIRNGRIHRCPFVACSNFVKDYFNVDIKVSADDYLEMKSITDWNQVLDFLSKPSSFCGYCDCDDWEWVNWDRSELKRNEFLIEEIK